MSSTVNQFSIIYCKTAAGEHEIATRQHGLFSKQRQALILIDGKKNHAQLSQLLATTELDRLISELLKLGLIGQVSATPLLIQPIPVPDDVICIAANPPQPVVMALDIERLNAIKQLMIDSSKILLGIFANTLIEKINAIEDAGQLSPAIAQWNLSLRESKNGQMQAEQYLKAIKTLMK